MSVFKIMADFYFHAEDDLNAANIARQVIAKNIPDGWVRWVSYDAKLKPMERKEVSLEGISVNIPPENFPPRPNDRNPGTPGTYKAGYDFFIEVDDRYKAWIIAQRYLDKHFPESSVYGVSVRPEHHIRTPISLVGIPTDNIPKPTPETPPEEKLDEFGGKEVVI